MRIQLVGQYSLDELQEALLKVIGDLRENNINTFRQTNLYFRPCVDGREIDLTAGGKSIDHLVYDLERKPQIPVKARELSVVRSHKVVIESN